MVSCDNASTTDLVFFLLEQALCDIMDRALEAQQEVEEDSLVS